MHLNSRISRATERLQCSFNAGTKSPAPVDSNGSKAVTSKIELVAENSDKEADLHATTSGPCGMQLPPIIPKLDKINSTSSNIATHLPPITGSDGNQNTNTSSNLSSSISNNKSLGANTASCRVTFSSPLVKDVCDTNTDSIDVPPILHQLEQMNYSEDDDESDSDETSSSDDDNQDDEERDDDMSLTNHNLKIPDLQSAKSLPWPSILQYVRESETMAGQYFSLQNKEAVERRNVKAQAMMGQKEEEEVPLLERTSVGTLAGDECTTVNPVGPVALEESDVVSACHFCGKKLPRRSLLAETKNVESIREQVSM